MMASFCDVAPGFQGIKSSGEDRSTSGDTMASVCDAVSRFQGFKSSAEDSGLHRGGWFGRMRRRFGGFVKWTSLAVLVMALVHPTAGKESVVPLRIPSTSTTDEPQKNIVSTTTSYKTTEDNDSTRTGQDGYYEYSTMDDTNQRVEKEVNDKYSAGTGADHIVTTKAYTVATAQDNEIQKSNDVKLLQRENFGNETKNNRTLSSIAINDQIDDPNTNLATEKYSQTTNVAENKSVFVPDNRHITPTETMHDNEDKVIEKVVDILSRSQYASNYSYDLRDVRPANRFTTETNKPFVTSSSTKNAFDHKVVKDNKSFSTSPIIHNNSKHVTEIRPTKPVQMTLHYKSGHDNNITGNQSFQKDLGFYMPVTKKVYTKPKANISPKNYFQKLFRYIFSKTKEERKNIRKTFLKKEKLPKLEIIKAVCENVGPCNMTRSKKFLLKPLLKELRTETNKIFKTVKTIKGLLYLLDMPHKKYNDQRESDIIKLNSIIARTYEKKSSGHLTENEIMQIDFIKNNTDVFVDSVGKFASILNKLIEILTSEVAKRSHRIRIQEEVDSEKLKVQTIFRRIKTVLDEHDQGVNSLIKTLNHNLNQKDRIDVLHFIYRISDTMDNYKYTVLEILGKRKGILDRIIELLKAEKHQREKMESEIKIEDLKKAKETNEIERKRKLEEIAIKRKNVDATREKIEGVPIWNVGRPDRRRKRQLGDDNEGVYQYLLIIMEFLLKQVVLTSTAPPVKDGIEILIEVIQNAPDIEPMPRPCVKTYHNRKELRELKEFLQKVNAISSAKRKEIDVVEVNKLVDKLNIDESHLQDKHIVQNLTNLRNIEIKKLNDAKTKAKNVATVEYEEDDDNNDSYDEYEDEPKNRYETYQNLTKLKKVKEQLVQISAEDPNNLNLGKIIEKMVFKRVSTTCDPKKIDTDVLHNKNPRSESIEVVPVKVEEKSKKSITENVEFESVEKSDNTTVTEPTLDNPTPVTRKNHSSEGHDRTSEPSKLEQYKNEEQQYQSKPKIVWVADADEDNLLSDIAPDTTTTATAKWSSTTTPVPVTLANTETSPKTKRDSKRNSTAVTPEQILLMKETSLLQSLDYITSDKHPPASGEDMDEVY